MHISLINLSVEEQSNAKAEFVVNECRWYAAVDDAEAKMQIKLILYIMKIGARKVVD